MSGDKTRDLRKGTRRNFLRKLSAMGVSGVFSDTIEDKCGENDYQLTRQGTVSETDTGKITRYDSDNMDFAIEPSSEEGDSGGPVFETLWGAKLIAGITRAQDWEIRCYYMEDAETQLNVVI